MPPIYLPPGTFNVSFETKARVADDVPSTLGGTGNPAALSRWNVATFEQVVNCTQIRQLRRREAEGDDNDNDGSASADDGGAENGDDQYGPGGTKHGSAAALWRTADNAELRALICPDEAHGSGGGASANGIVDGYQSGIATPVVATPHYIHVDLAAEVVRDGASHEDISGVSTTQKSLSPTTRRCGSRPEFPLEATVEVTYLDCEARVGGHLNHSVADHYLPCQRCLLNASCAWLSTKGGGASSSASTSGNGPWQTANADPGYCVKWDNSPARLAAKIAAGYSHGDDVPFLRHSCCVGGCSHGACDPVDSPNRVPGCTCGQWWDTVWWTGTQCEKLNKTAALWIAMAASIAAIALLAAAAYVVHRRRQKTLVDGTLEELRHEARTLHYIT